MGTGKKVTFLGAVSLSLVCLSCTSCRGANLSSEPCSPSNENDVLSFFRSLKSTDAIFSFDSGFLVAKMVDYPTTYVQRRIYDEVDIDVKSSSFGLHRKRRLEATKDTTWTNEFLDEKASAGISGSVLTETDSVHYYQSKYINGKQLEDRKLIKKSSPYAASSILSDYFGSFLGTFNSVDQKDFFQYYFSIYFWSIYSFFCNWAFLPSSYQNFSENTSYFLSITGAQISSDFSYQQPYSSEEKALGHLSDSSYRQFSGSFVFTFSTIGGFHLVFEDKKSLVGSKIAYELTGSSFFDISYLPKEIHPTAIYSDQYTESDTIGLSR